MMQQAEIQRGRPRGQLTRAKRKALDFILAKEAANENYTLGQLMRGCGFSDRSNALRTKKGLKEMGLI